MDLAPGLDLDAAKRRVIREAQQDPVPDILGYADYANGWDGLRDDLVARIESDSYTPCRPEIIEIAKTSLVTRPIARLAFVDRVYYEALVESIALQLDSLLPDAVYSARLSDIQRDSSPQRRGVVAWTRGNDAAIKLATEYEQAFMLSTDISSFYEYIELPILFDELATVAQVPQETLDPLRGFLRRFVDIGHAWGLPQNHTASSILSSFYLLPIDALVLRTNGVEHVRYGDDIKVFADNAATLRRCLKECITLLRSRHLNVAVHKTRIIDSDDIEKELTDERKDAIKYGLEINDPATPAQLHELFDEATGGSEVIERDVAFAVHRLQQLGDPHAVRWILEHLYEVPFLATLLVSYLSELADRRSEIEPAVARLLADSDRNIYPHLEQQLVRMLARTKAISDDTYHLVWRILHDEQKAA